jgi:hypothetical protein
LGGSIGHYNQTSTILIIGNEAISQWNPSSVLKYTVVVLWLKIQWKI